MTVLAGFRAFSRDYLEQFHLSIVVSFSRLTMGVSMGWITPVLLKLPIQNPEIYKDDNHGSWIAAAACFGNTVGCSVGGFLLYKFGRKRTMLLSSPVMIWGLLLTAFSDSFDMIIVGRFVTGFGSGIAIPAAQIYIAECTRPEVRGRFCSFPPIFLLIGNFLGNIMSSYLPWDQSLFVITALAVMYFIFLLPLPDSPPWLFSRGRVEEAEAAIMWLNKNENLDMIWYKYKTNKEGLDNSDSCLRMYFKKSVMYPFMIVSMLLTFQLFTGIVTFTFYSSQIFQTANTTLDFNLQTIITGATRIPGIAIGLIAIDKYGRKPLLYWSGSLIGITLAFFGLYYYLEPSGQMDNFRWLPLFCLCVFMIAFHLGLSSIPYLIVGEILPENGRSILGGVATCFVSLLTAVLIKTYHDINHQFGIFSQFWMFSACSFISCLFVWKFVPETKNKTLQEIEEFFCK